jgi:hypothetical protein
MDSFESNEIEDDFEKFDEFGRKDKTQNISSSNPYEFVLKKQTEEIDSKEKSKKNATEKEMEAFYLNVSQIERNLMFFNEPILSQCKISFIYCSLF